MVLVGHTTAEIALHQTAEAVPVSSTFQQFAASAPRADLAIPEYHYSTPSRYQSSRYDSSHNDGRFAKGKGRGKGKSFNAKSKRGAMPKDWDPEQLVLPE